MFDQLVGLLKALFKTDKHVTESKVFTLQHRINFFVIMIGIVALFASNFTGNAITCRSGSDFDKNYCFLHGGLPVAPHLNMGCAQTVTDESKQLRTNYYIWLPYVLIICVGIVKAPHFIWKTFGERGMIVGSVELKEKPEKMAERYRKLKKLKGKRSRSRDFCMSFLFCQFLNFMSIIALFLILNALLGGNFWNYGSGSFSFMLGDEDQKKSGNPMCNVFPTEINCVVRTGGANGGFDESSDLCLLSNNMFNQYYFLILWFWWSFLLVISGVDFIYDFVKCLIPAFSYSTFYYFTMKPSNLEDEEFYSLRKQLSSHDIYLLTRIIQNLKGSETEALLKELASGGNAELLPFKADKNGDHANYSTSKI